MLAGGIEPVHHDHQFVRIDLICHVGQIKNASFELFRAAELLPRFPTNGESESIDADVEARLGARVAAVRSLIPLHVAETKRDSPRRGALSNPCADQRFRASDERVREEIDVEGSVDVRHFGLPNMAYAGLISLLIL